MGLLKYLKWTGMVAEKEPSSNTRFSDIGLEEAVRQSEHWNARAQETSWGPTIDLRYGEANYHRLLAIGKRIGLPEDHPLVVESNKWYARAQVANMTHTATLGYGEAIYNLSKAIDQHLLEGPKQQTPYTK